MTSGARLTEHFRAEVQRALPLPGGGRTGERFDALFRVARSDMALGRLVEAHHDAHAIAAELGCPVADGDALYGVWAASGAEPVLATTDAAAYRLTGTLPWCGGATIVDRAIVVASLAGRNELFDVATADLQVLTDGPVWSSPAFAEIGTTSVGFSDVPATLLRSSGSATYLHRPGFWHGAIGVAACWAGGAAGLFDAHRAHWRRRDPHALAHFGGADAELATIDAVLRQAAAQIDADPDDIGSAQLRALRVRHAIDRAATRMIEHLQVGAGPAPLAYAPEVIMRTQQLTMSLRQCHGERDLEALGTTLLT